MKDITHYFQAPDKNPAPKDAMKSEKASQNFGNVSKSTSGKNNSRKNDGQSVDKVSATCNIKENVEEKFSSGKKRRDSKIPSKPKNKKLKLDDTSVNVESVNSSTKKRSKKLGCTIDDDSSDESFIVRDVRRTYTRKRKPIVETVDELESVSLNSIQSSVELRILLEDCMKTQKIQINHSNDCKHLGKLDESDSDSCFVSEKKSKKKLKSMNTEKLEEESGKNNLLNYFNKIDKSEAKTVDASAPTVITVHAIVHSPPKDKSKFIGEKQNTRGSVVIPKQTKGKKKSCSFDDIKVIETETILCDDVLEVAKSAKVKAPHEISDSSKNSDFKVTPWKMKVKLNTPKTKNNKSKSKKLRALICETESEDETEINSQDENSDNDVQFVSVTKLATEPNSPKPIKLAPLFCKKRENTKIADSGIRISDEAKRLFLESGVPEAIKKKMGDHKNTLEEEYNGRYVFPKFNHILQKNVHSFVWKLEEYCGFRMKLSEDYITKNISSQWCPFFINKNCSIEDRDERSETFDLRNEITSLIKQEPSVNVNDIHCSVKQLNKARENDKSLCWTEKYYPSAFQDMIGNTNSLHKLKEWIESHKRLKQVFLDNDQSSGDEFIYSDDSNCSTDVKNNIAILFGPSGCGKTCAVYMLANELGFKVLEVNAGSNRTGKRIIDELLEATQSHRVKRMFSGSSETQKIKKNKKGRESKKDKKAMSLILIEDVDILFENHDEGFLSALNSLASLSKRPLIFTANNLNHPHLRKYNNSQNLVLKFDYPSRSSMNVWLKLIALTEGAKLNDEILIELYKIAGSDLRKNLLQLQMLISSNFRHPKSSYEQLFHQNWLSKISLLNMKKQQLPNNETKITELSTLFSDDEDYCTSEDNVSQIKVENERKPKSEEESRIDKKALLESAKFYDYVANLDCFRTENERKIFPAEVMYQHNCNENYNVRRLNDDLKEFFETKLFVQFHEITPFSFQKYYNATVRSSKIQTTSENVFNGFNPKISNHMAKNCDYLPVIREIARSERCKVSSRTKRSSRYFSYLKSLSIDISDRETEMLCNTFM